MHESILCKHGNIDPNTYRQGTVPIDGIFSSKNIIAARCGYTSAKWKMPFDHRMICNNLQTCELLEDNASFTWKSQARTLKMNNPRTVTCSLHVRVRLIEQDKMINKVKDLTESISQHGITEEATSQIEKQKNMPAAQLLEPTYNVGYF
jgi:hypothetical protein